jgi:hypothetical protein
MSGLARIARSISELSSVSSSDSHQRLKSTAGWVEAEAGAGKPTNCCGVAVFGAW